MATTQFVPSAESNGTSNLMGLLAPHQQQALMLIMPRDMEKVFGAGIEDIYEPERGYEDPEWYFESSDGCVWGIGWRFGRTRLRGRGPKGVFGGWPQCEKAAEFVDYIIGELA